MILKWKQCCAKKPGVKAGSLKVLLKMLLANSLEADAQEYQETVEAIREALASGPGKPIEQYIAEQRAKHGYPDDWPRRDAVKEVSPGVFVAVE